MSQAVGERLKKVRGERGLSLDQAAQTTRIRRNYLEALERGDREALPSAVQGRGFLRLYAGYLHLPAEELVAEWEGRPLTPPPVQFPEPPHPVRKKLVFLEPAPLPPPAEEADQPEPAEEPPVQRPEPALGSSQAIFIEIGAALRRQREILGLSLGDVERHTRLRQHYLRAFEAGRLDDLPSTVQSRGMLSNYAAFLNMDTEGLMLRFAEGLQVRRLERLPPAPAPGLFAKRRGPSKALQTGASARKLITPDLLFIGGLILVLFVFIVWTTARISSDRSLQSKATLPSVSDVLLYTTSPTAPTLSPTSGTPSSELASTQPTDSAPSGESTEQITSSPDAPGTTLQSGSQTVTLAAMNQDPVQVYIVARRRAFLRVTIDGQIKFNGRTVPGNAYPFSGLKTVEILTGDAAALQVFYNQRDIGSLGASGQALDLSFTKEGVLTPTATITPTITPTPRISLTPTPGSSVSPTPSPTVTPLVP